MASDPSVTTSTTPTTLPATPASRTIVCCFDGTGNKFGEISNVARFFSALVKDKHDQQIVYYQPGIGTYTPNESSIPLFAALAATFDQAVAHHFDDHVKDGYRFIMNNYRPNDKICLFGFSRGAYTARVLMGMIYKIGLLPRENIQQVDFAYSLYLTPGESGRNLCREFRVAFGLPVTVEFVGAWDTVASVGALFPRIFPHTSGEYAVKTFRHALALDECRAMFQAKSWGEDQIENDYEDPVFTSLPPSEGSRDNWEYTIPCRQTADVREVWFSGSHSDVGGGSHRRQFSASLSYVSLRWMVQEVISAGAGILFDDTQLGEIRYIGAQSSPGGKNNSKVPSQSSQDTSNDKPPKNGSDSEASAKEKAEEDATRAALQFWVSGGGLPPPVDSHDSHNRDAGADISNQLNTGWGWWIIEFFLSVDVTFQEEYGSLVKAKLFNRGAGRFIPYRDGKVLVHKSVEARLDQYPNYKPSAINWEILKKDDKIEYVN